MSSKKATEESLEELHGILALELARKIREGTATAADMAVARQFLKDNGIDAIPKKGSPIADLAGSLPFTSPDGVAEEEQSYH